MEIKVTCKCGSVFSVQRNCKNKGPFVCQNCGRPLPGAMSEHILKFLEVYNSLYEELRPDGLYEVEVPGFKI